MTAIPAAYQPRLRVRRLHGKVFHWLCGSMVLFGSTILAILITRVFWDGWEFLSLGFLTRSASLVEPESSGIRPALYGTFWLVSLTVLFAVPVGIGAAAYLQEYAPKNRLTAIIEVNIANLAGVPSIVYGMLGFALFARWLHLDRSVLTGALTMSLVVLPVVIVASREALISVPDSQRLAAFALGAGRWQTISAHVLPAAMPGILTGVILAVCRAIGEAAPLVMIGAFAFVRFAPSGPMDSFTALPIQIYTWCDQPQEVFQRLAATAIIVLLGVLIPLNGLAIGVRAWQQRKKHW